MAAAASATIRLLMLVLSMPMCDASCDCKELTWLQFQGRFYSMPNETLKYDAAELTCKQMGGALTAPKTAAINSFVKHDVLKDEPYDGDAVWIGLTKDGFNESPNLTVRRQGWFWSDGTELKNDGCNDWFYDAPRQYGVRAAIKNREWHGLTVREGAAKFVCERETACETNPEEESETSTPKDSITTTTAEAITTTTAEAITTTMAEGSKTTTTQEPVEQTDACTGRREVEECEVGWTRFADSCYLAVYNWVDFQTAQLHCKDTLCATLVSITSKEESDFFKTVRKDGGFWLGLQKDPVGSACDGDFDCIARDWNWLDGSKYEWTNWDNGLGPKTLEEERIPLHKEGDVSYCAAVEESSIGYEYWYMKLCDEHDFSKFRNFMCEKPIVKGGEIGETGAMVSAGSLAVPSIIILALTTLLVFPDQPDFA